MRARRLAAPRMPETLWRQLVNRMCVTGKLSKRSIVKAASFRDATGLGRKRAIQILEFFDRIGFLRRVGDIHWLRTGTTLFLNELP